MYSHFSVVNQVIPITTPALAMLPDPGLSVYQQPQEAKEELVGPGHQWGGKFLSPQQCLGVKENVKRGEQVVCRQYTFNLSASKHALSRTAINLQINLSHPASL